MATTFDDLNSNTSIVTLSLPTSFTAINTHNSELTFNATVNITSISTSPCDVTVSSTTVKSENSFTSHDALLYIVVLLSCYAFSMVILMVKYIRREREEAEMANYYVEYVSREKFKTPKYEIQECMMKLNIHNLQIIREKEVDDDDYVSCIEAPLVLPDTPRKVPVVDKLV